jgi:hypothetical protein
MVKNRLSLVVLTSIFLLNILNANRESESLQNLSRILFQEEQIAGFALNRRVDTLLAAELSKGNFSFHVREIKIDINQKNLVNFFPDIYRRHLCKTLLQLLKHFPQATQEALGRFNNKIDTGNGIYIQEMQRFKKELMDSCLKISCEELEVSWVEMFLSYGANPKYKSCENKADIQPLVVSVCRKVGQSYDLETKGKCLQILQLLMLQLFIKNKVFTIVDPDAESGIQELLKKLKEDVAQNAQLITYIEGGILP